MTVILEWFIGGVLFIFFAAQMVFRLYKEAADISEFFACCLAYMSPIPGGFVTTVGPFGVTPLVLLIPGIAYAEILAITRGHPITLLGSYIGRVDRQRSRKLAGRILLAFLATATAGVAFVTLFHFAPT